MKKIDYKKELKHLYRPSAKHVMIVNGPPMNFLMIDGEGDPNTSQTFQNAVESLYALSYAIKFMVKKGELAVDYGVLPLEGLWWPRICQSSVLRAKATGNGPLGNYNMKGLL